MVVHLLRHTEPKIEKGICYGQADIKLADSFSKELMPIKAKVSALPIDVFFSSPLHRCAILSQALCTSGREVQYDKRLMELDFGKWELKKWDVISKTKEAKKWFDDFVNEPCPDGESYQDILIRVKDFIAYLEAFKTIKEPLVVTHAGVIRAFYCIANMSSLETSFKIKIEYGELISLKIKP
jgi:alpha-ribazole phosphatase